MAIRIKRKSNWHNIIALTLLHYFVDGRRPPVEYFMEKHVFMLFNITLQVAGVLVDKNICTEHVVDIKDVRTGLWIKLKNLL